MNFQPVTFGFSQFLNLIIRVLLFVELSSLWPKKLIFCFSILPLISSKLIILLSMLSDLLNANFSFF